MDNSQIFENGHRLTLPDFSIQEKYVDKSLFLIDCRKKISASKVN